MSKYLYGASVNQIQKYIFASNELKSIVGASEIIKKINTKIDEKYKANILINAAGNIKLIFDASQKAAVEDIVKNFVKEIKQSAFGLSMTQAVVEYEEGGLKDALEELEQRLATQRSIPQMPLDTSISIIKLTKKHAKPAISKEQDRATQQKESANSSSGNIPKNRKNKTAIIHADGNGLGAMIASMLKEKKSDTAVQKALQEFSTNLEVATKNAFELAKHKREGIRDVILGGDDMTIICDADIALDFVEEFLQEFEHETKRLMGGDGLTACAGVAFANHKYPFHYAINLAESLCSYAKVHSKKIDAGKAPSSIMFHNIQSSNFTNYDMYVEKELTLTNEKESVYLNYGPYFIQEQKEYPTLKRFLHLSSALSLSGSPESRFREWLTILAHNSVEADERLKRIDSMMDLKDKIYKKSALSNALKKLNKELSITNLCSNREGKKYTPIHDIHTHLSVTTFQGESDAV